MRYYLDTEFIEDGKTIDLLSIGIVAADGRQLYLESSEASHSRAGQWVRDNVIAHLSGGNIAVNRSFIRDAILELIGDDQSPEFWAYFADYDWVVLCQLFGRMIDLPSHFPMYCLDLKQLMRTFSIEKSDLPKQAGTAHNALEDARWVEDAVTHILRLDRVREVLNV